MGILFLLFFACLVPRYPDVEVNPGPRNVGPRNCRLLCSNIRGLHCNLTDLKAASRNFDVVCLSETLVSGHRHVAELRLPCFGKPFQRLRGSVPGSSGMAVYVREGFCVSRRSEFECPCCEVVVLKVVGSVQNFYVFSVYRSPSTDDRIFNCLMDSMAAIQLADPRSVFVFAGDFNVHHVEWLGSAYTSAYGRSAFDFSNQTGCEQLVSGPTHNHGGILDLLMTNVPDLVSVSVVAPVGGSDHSSLSISLNVRQRTPNFTIRKKVFLKSRVDWDAVSAAVSALPWRQIRMSADPGSDLDASISAIVDQHIPHKYISIRSKDEPWFDAACRRAHQLKQEA